MKYLVLYDADCGVCSYSINFIKKRDKHKVFEFMGMQEPKAKELIYNYQLKDFDEDTLVLIKNGNVYLRANAVLEIIKELSFPWTLLRVFKIIPLRVLDIFYKLFAKNRYRIFSKNKNCKIYKS